MTDLIAGVTIAAAVLEAFAIVGILLQYGREEAAWRSERKDLLNRVMARNYQEFTYAANVSTTSDVPQLSTDALEAAWYEAEAREAAAKDAAGAHNIGDPVTEAA